MIPLNLKFLNFKSKAKYLELQESFYLNCEKKGGPEVKLSKLLPNDFSIIYKSIEDGKEKYDSLVFNEYIKSRIPYMTVPICKEINRRVNSLEIIRGDELKRFVDKRLKKLDIYNKKITNSDFIDPDVIELLLKEIENVKAYLNSKAFEDGLILDKRIKVKWPKNDLLLLIALLSKNDQLSYKNTTTEIGLAIDQVFSFYNKKDDEFKNYQGSGKKYNDILNGNASVKRSLNRLKELLQSEDFYNKI